MSETIKITAFGQSLSLTCPEGQAEARGARVTQLAEVQERFLASRVLPRQGLALDVGSGIGWFALPFARAFQGWTVVCIEPDPEAFAALEQNVRDLKLENVLLLQAGLHPEAAAAPALPEGDVAQQVAALAPTDRLFRVISGHGPSYLPVAEGLSARSVMLPALAPADLAALKPDLLNLHAPGCEDMLADLAQGSAAPFVMGELFAHVPAARFLPAEGQARESYLQAGPHVIRRDYEHNWPQRRDGLDVAVAMYNARDFIVECVDSLLAAEDPAIRVLVVDDGSTDDAATMLRSHYAGHERVEIVQKANGGCASARNFGRHHSTASHLAFVDADDRVDADLFPSLLELARQTGAEVVEGEFKFWTLDAADGEVFRPSYETQDLPGPGEHGLGDLGYTWLPREQVIAGQPTIWRRIYRRDFLDRHRIAFPEHVRAFDDQIFQILTAWYAGSIAHVHGPTYHYRQHPAQDIKQGDERHFYSFNMFRAVLQRALKEGWNDLRPITVSLCNTIRWSHGGLRADLKPLFLEGAAELLAAFALSLPGSVDEALVATTEIDGLALMFRLRCAEARGTGPSHGYGQIDSWLWQPEFLRMNQEG